MSHPIESFAAAVAVMARHGHIKQRLVDAFEDHLGTIEEDGLPIPLRQPFADLKHLMGRVAPLNGEGPICASVRKMSVEEADHCAQLMVDLYGLAVRHCDAGQRTLPLVEQAQDAQVPPFLVKSG
ncbi:MAG: hypothetical protein U5K76_13010 [Woeseiaceae bacterium]|nr:hypothetical protein [Woeseiaceae bacterium]